MPTKIDFIQVEWILETHAHADHLSAAPYIQEKLGGKIAIGENIRLVQDVFAGVFNLGPNFQRDGSQFDKLFADGETFRLGELTASVIYTPGHTPACVCYLIGDALFTGDTLFMPDYGTARCDFPGGSSKLLYESIQRIMICFQMRPRVCFCGSRVLPSKRWPQRIRLGDYCWR